MTYASNTRRPNPVALAGALGIPAAFAALLVVGLAVKVVIAPEPPTLKGFTVKPIPIPPPPPPEPVEQASAAATTQPRSSTTTVTRPDNIPIDFGSSNPIASLPGIDELVGPVSSLVDFGIPGPSPSASPYDPVAAAPRGNPGRWVRNSDFRARWIREGLSGTAHFTLTIDTAGKVAGCSITRSTGHAALDAATCELVGKRASFAPARDASGKPVTGSYASMITWRIPE